MTEDQRARICECTWMNLCCSMASSGKDAKRVIMVGPNDIAAAVGMALHEVFPEYRIDSPPPSPMSDTH